MTNTGKIDARFPLAVCLAGLVVTGLALSACVLGVQWGAGVSDGEILDRAWMYVNFGLTVMLLLVWPGMKLRGSDSVGVLATGMWELCAIAVSAVPALSAAAWLSGVSGAALARMLGLQLGLALLGFGLTMWRGRETWHARMAGLGLALTLGLPMVAYLQAEFAPAAWRGWFAATPLLTVLEAAGRRNVGMVWGLALLWAAVGIGLAVGGAGEKVKK